MSLILSHVAETLERGRKMSDSRTRGEDRIQELAEAEENQRQLLGAAPAPSLARVSREQSRRILAVAAEDVSAPDDGPELRISCGPVTVRYGGEFVEIGNAQYAHQDAKDIWEALTVLIREEVIK